MIEQVLTTKMKRRKAIPILVAAMLALPSALAQTTPQIGDACQLTQSVQACVNLARTSSTKPAAGLFAAMAVSTSTGLAGASHGQTTKDTAEKLAMANCTAIGGKDCSLVKPGGQSTCLALAVSLTSVGNYSEVNFGYGANADRAASATQALTECRSDGGKNCVIRATPCAGDNPVWPSKLPLQAGGAPGSVDQNLVGTWELDINGPAGGRWVWEIGANGTYQVHSEAFDSAQSNLGTFTPKTATIPSMRTTSPGMTPAPIPTRRREP
jgi:hypothetical protein